MSPVRRGKELPIHNRLSVLRAERGFTRAQLAEAVDVNPHALPAAVHPAVRQGGLVTAVRERRHAWQYRDAARYSDRLPGRRNRNSRRRAVIAWLVCAVGTLFAGDFRGPFFFGWRGLLVVTVVLQMPNKVFTSNVGERSARTLDGRELALRGRYGYVGILVAVWSMVIAAMVLASTPLGSTQFGPFVVLVGLVALVSTVPTGLPCWQSPDDEPDTVAEGEHRG